RPRYRRECRNLRRDQRYPAPATAVPGVRAHRQRHAPRTGHPAPGAGELARHVQPVSAVRAQLQQYRGYPGGQPQPDGRAAARARPGRRGLTLLVRRDAGAAAARSPIHRGGRRHAGRAGRDPHVRGLAGALLRPRAYTNPDMAVMLPMFIDPNGPMGRFGTIGVARLAPGVTLDAARREIDQLQARIPEHSNNQMTAETLDRFGWSASLQTLRDRITGDIRPALLIVLGTVAFLLLVACASVANLF